MQIDSELSAYINKQILFAQTNEWHTQNRQMTKQSNRAAAAAVVLIAAACQWQQRRRTNKQFRPKQKD